MFSISVKLGLLPITLILSMSSSVSGLSLKFVLIVTLGRSLIQIKISNSPIIDSCGTPDLTIPQLEKVLLLKIYPERSLSAVYITCVYCSHHTK